MTSFKSYIELVAAEAGLNAEESEDHENNINDLFLKSLLARYHDSAWAEKTMKSIITSYAAGQAERARRKKGVGGLESGENLAPEEFPEPKPSTEKSEGE